MSLEDNFFIDLANDKPYLKAAFEGFQGAGKTYTAALLIIGLYHRVGSTKPVVILTQRMHLCFYVGYSIKTTSMCW